MRPKPVERAALLFLLTGVFLLAAASPSLAFIPQTNIMNAFGGAGPVLIAAPPPGPTPIVTIFPPPTYNTGSAVVVPIGPGSPGIMVYPPVSGTDPLFIPPGGDSFPIPTGFALPQGQLLQTPGASLVRAVSVTGVGTGNIIVIPGATSSTVVLPGNDDFPIPNEFIDPAIKGLLGIK